MKDAQFDLVDVSHSVEEGLITYPGLPAPAIGDFLSREQSGDHYTPGTEFHIGRIDMVANTGTYIDAPFHRYPDGADLSDLPLRKLANLDGLVVRIPPERQPAIDASFFHDLALVGRAVLIHTGWSRYWNSDQYFEGHPFLTEDAALYLRLPSKKYADYREKIWDHAAGALIVEEAGGRVTDMNGRDLDFASDYRMRDNRGVVVSDGLRHAAALEALAKISIV